MTCKVVTGTDPMIIRQGLGRALPNAPPPEQQTVKELEILHTTLARLVEQPVGSIAADDDAENASGDMRDTAVNDNAAQTLVVRPVA